MRQLLYFSFLIPIELIMVGIVLGFFLAQTHIKFVNDLEVSRYSFRYMEIAPKSEERKAI